MGKLHLFPWEKKIVNSILKPLLNLQFRVRQKTIMQIVFSLNAKYSLDLATKIILTKILHDQTK